jgi:flagellar FliJ protein
MKKFKFALEGYLKVKKTKEQEKLGELAQVMRKVNVFRDQQQAFDTQYSTLLQAQRSEFLGKPVPINQLKDMYDYLGALRLRKDTATKHIENMEPEVAEKRNAYNAARKDRRVVEILRERKMELYKADAAKEEQNFLDEMNQARSINR